MMTEDYCPVTLIQKTQNGLRWCHCSETEPGHETHRFLGEDFQGPEFLVPFQPGRIMIEEPLIEKPVTDARGDGHGNG
jgi:hypothetical protein